MTTLQGIVEGLERDLASQTEASQTTASQIEALKTELASQAEASQTVVTLQGIIEVGDLLGLLY